MSGRHIVAHRRDWTSHGRRRRQPEPQTSRMKSTALHPRGAPGRKVARDDGDDTHQRRWPLPLNSALVAQMLAKPILLPKVDACVEAALEKGWPCAGMDAQNRKRNSGSLRRHERSSGSRMRNSHGKNKIPLFQTPVWLFSQNGIINGFANLRRCLISAVHVLLSFRLLQDEQEPLLLAPGLGPKRRHERNVLWTRARTRTGSF